MKRKKDKLSKLQQKFKKKLKGAQFRWINEELYTKDSEISYKEMNKQRTSSCLVFFLYADCDRNITITGFKAYHQGFKEQVCKWPINPVKVIAEMLRRKTKDVALTVADFGCGEAFLAKTLGKIHKVHSFDMVAVNNMVTACDMANVPLKDASVDVAVFCLSLMGTNLRDFLMEAFRVLKPGAELVVAEVKSRFVMRGNKDEEDQKGSDVEGIRTFVRAMKKMHFKLQKKDESNKMFVLFRFRRTKKISVKMPDVFEWNFKPCLYKKR